MWAYNVDLLLLLILYYAFTIIIPNDRVLYGTCFLLTLFYHGLFESSSWQGTPGKKIMKLRVTKDDGEPISIIMGLSRFLLKILSLTLFYVGFIMIGFDKRGKGLHDRIVGTIVTEELTGDTL